jgi:hypothetical protein
MTYMKVSNDIVASVSKGAYLKHFLGYAGVKWLIINESGDQGCIRVIVERDVDSVSVNSHKIKLDVHLSPHQCASLQTKLSKDRARQHSN